jgi:hypothetical protein
MAKSKDKTANDEAIARELQEQFRREVEQYASSSVWSDIHSVFTPRSNNVSEGYSSAVEDIESIPVVDAIPEDGATPPRNKKKFVHDLSFSTESTSPSTSLDGSPFERTSSALSGPISIDEFIPVDVDTVLDEKMRKKQQQRKDEELARRLEREMRDEALARELRAGQEFNVAVQTESDADLARRLQLESQAEEGGRRRRGLPADSTRAQKFIYYGSRIFSVVLVICVSYLVFMMVWGQNVNSGLDPASW